MVFILFILLISIFLVIYLFFVYLFICLFMFFPWDYVRLVKLMLTGTLDLWRLCKQVVFSCSCVATWFFLFMRDHLVILVHAWPLGYIFCTDITFSWMRIYLLIIVLLHCLYTSYCVTSWLHMLCGYNDFVNAYLLIGNSLISLSLYFLGRFLKGWLSLWSIEREESEGKNVN